MKSLFSIILLSLFWACADKKEDQDILQKLDSLTFPDSSYFNLRQQTVDTLRYLEKYTTFPGYAVGYAGRPSKHLSTTHWFVKNLAPKEAEVLRKHQNTFIQALAIKRLYYSCAPNFYNYLIESYTDTAVVLMASGCTVDQYTLFEFYLKTIHYPYNSLGTSSWTVDQRRYVDSLAKSTRYGNIGPPENEVIGNPRPE